MDIKLLKKHLSYLCPFTHFQKRTDGMEGSCAADVEVCLVVGLQNPDEVITLSLEKEQKDGTFKPPTMLAFNRLNMHMERRLNTFTLWNTVSVYVVTLTAL